MDTVCYLYYEGRRQKRHPPAPRTWHMGIITNELWRVRACVTTVTFELAIDGFGDKRLGGVNVQ